MKAEYVLITIVLSSLISTITVISYHFFVIRPRYKKEIRKMVETFVKYIETMDKH